MILGWYSEGKHGRYVISYDVIGGDDDHDHDHVLYGVWSPDSTLGHGQ